MGLDVFLFNPRLQSEEPNDYWEWDVVTEILARDAKDPDNLYFFEYPDGGGAGEVFGLVERRDQSLTFAHFGGRTFMARMFEITHRTRSLIYWTDGAASPRYGVTHEDLVEAVPDEFTKGERPHLIRDLDHMAELIGRHKLTPMTYIHCI